MSVSGSGSFPGNHNLPPNGRKRKLSSRLSRSSSDPSSPSDTASSSSSTTSKQSKLNFTPNHKRQKISVNNSNHSPPLHHTNSTEETLCSDMAHQPGTNNRMSFNNNSFVVGKAAAAGTNNHVKKPSQGKKLVIKNRKGKTERDREGRGLIFF